MKPTEILSDEHRIIEQVLDCLDRIAQDCAAQGRLDAASAWHALEFLRDFADRCHHGKEEAHLFPAMEAKGFARDGGPTGVMMYEHEQGRGHIRGMAAAIEDASVGKSQALTQFVHHARDYASLLREHIDKEDHCLFAMADQVLSQEDQQGLLEAFLSVDRELLGSAAHERLLGIANALAARFAIAPVGRRDHGGGCCGKGN